MQRQALARLDDLAGNIAANQGRQALRCGNQPGQVHPRVVAHELQRVTSVISQHGLNIEQTDRLSVRVPLDAPTEASKSCIELRVCGEPADIDALRAEFFNLAQELGVDIALQEDTLFRRNRRLAVFDMDSTLIEAEVIDELAKAAGVGEQVAAITERAMAGELDFKASFKERMALLKGLDVGVLDAIGASLRLTEGAEVLFAELKRLGYKTAILSGGFTYFTERLRIELGFDFADREELGMLAGQIGRGGWLLRCRLNGFGLGLFETKGLEFGCGNFLFLRGRHFGHRQK